MYQTYCELYTTQELNSLFEELQSINSSLSVGTIVYVLLKQKTLHPNKSTQALIELTKREFYEYAL